VLQLRRRRRSVVRVTVDAYELAYREAVRALEQQRAAAAELRGRASAMQLAVSSDLCAPQRACWWHTCSLLLSPQ
jgi:hypothetical protein